MPALFDAARRYRIVEAPPGLLLRRRTLFLADMQRPIAVYILALLLLTLRPAMAGVVTVCQCNIFEGGRWTEQDKSAVTHDTAARFAQWVATVNPPGSANPPIAVIGMEELIAESDRTIIESLLEQYTGVDWSSYRVAQGVNNASGIGFFWRPDLVESRPEWYLGEKILETIDNGYVLKFAGRLFRKQGTSEAFGLFCGKLLWGGAIINGHEVTEEERRQEAIRLKTWIVNGDPGSPGMSNFAGTTRIITTDLNTDTGTSTWSEMNLDYSDPTSQHTHNSFSGQTWMDLFGKRLDYIWWDFDSYTKQAGGFAANPVRSPHVGSDHRSVYATVNLHAVDLTPPEVSITSPGSGARVQGSVLVSAEASDGPEGESSGIFKVDFLVDGQPAWTDTQAPYEFMWNTNGLSTGVHTLSAKATDASSNRLTANSPVVSVWVGPPGSEPRIGEARGLANGSPVILFQKVVTADIGTYFYIEEPDRSSGLKVNRTSPPVGSLVNVSGSMNTVNGEREVGAAVVEVTGSTAPPAPLGLSNVRIGGEAAGPFTPGVQGGWGLNNIGLLVRTWGKVKAVVGSFYLYIDDGSNLKDGYGYTGVRVDVSGLSGWTPPPTGKTVMVTGLSSTATIAGKIQRRIKVRSAADIQILN